MSFSGCLINIMAETIYKIYRLRRQENKLVTDSNGIFDAPRDRKHVSLTYFLALEYNSRVIRERPINLCRPTLTDSNVNRSTIPGKVTQPSTMQLYRLQRVTLVTIRCLNSFSIESWTTKKGIRDRLRKSAPYIFLSHIK